MVIGSQGTLVFCLTEDRGLAGGHGCMYSTQTGRSGGGGTAQPRNPWLRASLSGSQKGRARCPEGGWQESAIRSGVGFCESPYRGACEPCPESPGLRLAAARVAIGACLLLLLLLQAGR